MESGSECKRCLSEVWEHGCTASCEDKGEAERIKLRRFNQGFMTEQEVRDWHENQTNVGL